MPLRYNIIIVWVMFNLLKDKCLGDVISSPECDRVSACLDKMEMFINLRRIRFVTTEGELTYLCKNASDQCILYLRETSGQCLSESEKEKVLMQQERASGMINLLCHENKFISPYLQHSFCVSKHEASLRQCYRNAEIPDDFFFIPKYERCALQKPQYTRSCCPLERFLDCVNSEVSRYCGTEAKDTMEIYIRKALGSRFESFCSDCNQMYPHVSHKCKEASSSTVIPSLLMVIFLTNIIHLH